MLLAALLVVGTHVKSGTGWSVGLIPRVRIWANLRARSCHGGKGDPRPHLSPAFGTATRICHRLELDSAISLLEKWLASCQNHTTCSGNRQSPSSHELPKRLLDVSEPNPRLVSVGKRSLLGPETARYMTLSHCWGPGTHIKPLQTTKATYQARMQGIEWSDLPPLFQDAMAITRKLGIQYLWIDSLCIIQDDDEDWNEQATQMSQVYSGSYLNLAAAAAPDSSHPLCDARYDQLRRGVDDVLSPTPQVTHAIEPAGGAMATVYVRIHNWSAHNQVLGHHYGREVEAPLLKRAWVLQERLLAPRTVYFAKSELMFQCREFVRCECNGIDNQEQILADLASNPDPFGPDPDGHIESVKSFTFDDLFDHQQRLYRAFAKLVDGTGSADSAHAARDFWMEAVQAYSALDLTRESDRPFAIAGIAKRIRTVTNDTYIAGLWVQDLPRELLWVCMGKRTRRTASHRTSNIPSWSWMSQNSAVWFAAYNRDAHFMSDPHLRIIATSPAGSETDYRPDFGLVAGAKIVLEAAVAAGTVCVNARLNTLLEIESPKDCNQLGSVPLTFQNVMDDIDRPYDPIDGLKPGDSVHCLIMGTRDHQHTYCLVIKEVENQQHGSVFRRVGTCSFGHYGVSVEKTPLENLPVKRVTLV